MLVVLTVKQIAHRSPSGFVHFTLIPALNNIHAVFTDLVTFLGNAALRTAVRETRFVRLQFELLRADDADFDGKRHYLFMITETGACGCQAFVQKRGYS